MMPLVGCNCRFGVWKRLLAWLFLFISYRHNLKRDIFTHLYLITCAKISLCLYVVACMCIVFTRIVISVFAIVVYNYIVYNIYKDFTFSDVSDHLPIVYVSKAIVQILKNPAISKDRNTVSYDRTNIDTFVNETSWNEINSKRKE